ncbi:MAG: cyclic nucleotide-binding domain-containing protein [Lachnospiraceae bacterium]|nr:cyclic nucleotide-binding domain-containing protein [Lachnospiraceae bacterium]
MATENKDGLKESAKGGKIVKYQQDSVILKEGELNHDMYKILSGHAELYINYGTKQEVLLGIIGPQACFGEFGLLLGKPSVYTAVAFSEVLVMRVSEDELESFIQNNHGNVIDIMRNMANSMSIMQAQIGLLTKELEEGKKPDETLLHETQRNLRGYAIYNPNGGVGLHGKMHFINARR